jgi:hypothetical protein
MANDINDNEAPNLEELERVQRYISGLRQMADFLNEHPELCPLDSDATYNPHSQYVRSDEAKAKLAHAVRTGGTWNKVSSDIFFKVERSFGPHLLRVMAYRQDVCEKVKTGEREEEAISPLVEKQIAAIRENAPKHKRMVETFEWKCPPSLLDTGEA